MESHPVPVRQLKERDATRTSSQEKGDNDEVEEGEGHEKGSEGAPTFHSLDHVERKRSTTTCGAVGETKEASMLEL